MKFQKSYLPKLRLLKNIIELMISLGNGLRMIAAIWSLNINDINFLICAHINNACFSFTCFSLVPMTLQSWS